MTASPACSQRCGRTGCPAAAAAPPAAAGWQTLGMIHASTSEAEQFRNRRRVNFLWFLEISTLPWESRRRGGRESGRRGAVLCVCCLFFVAGVSTTTTTTKKRGVPSHCGIITTRGHCSGSPTEQRLWQCWSLLRAERPGRVSRRCRVWARPGRPGSAAAPAAPARRRPAGA